MSRNRVFDDLNHVIDQFTIATSTKTILLSLKSMSSFNSIQIKKNLQYKLNKLLENVARTLYNIFNFFFIDEMF